MEHEEVLKEYESEHRLRNHTNSLEMAHSGAQFHFAGHGKFNEIPVDLKMLRNINMHFQDEIPRAYLKSVPKAAGWVLLV